MSWAVVGGLGPTSAPNGADRTRNATRPTWRHHKGIARGHGFRNEPANCHRRNDDFNNSGIELRSPALLKLSDNNIEAEALTIGAVSRHCINRIGYQDDSGAKRNCGSAKSHRITLAIPSLVT